MVFSKILVNGVPVTRAGEDKGKISKVSYDGLEGFFGKKSEIVKNDTGGKIVLEKPLPEFFSYLRITGNTIQNGTPSPDKPVDYQMTGTTKSLVDFSTNVKGSSYLKVTADNNAITFAGKTTPWDAYSSMLDITGVLENGKTYNLFQSIRFPAWNTAGAVYMQLHIKEKGTNIDKSVVESYYAGASFTAYVDVYDYKVQIISGETAGNLNTTIRFMICEDSTNLIYEPYNKLQLKLKRANETALTIPKITTLSDGTIIPLNFAKVNDVKDELRIENGRIIYIQRLNEIIFDGTEKWEFYEQVSDAYCYWLKTPSIIPNIYNFSFCNFYKNSSYIFAHGQIGQYCDHPEYPRKYFYTSYATTEEWKAHIKDLYQAGTPLKVLDTLATPIETDITNTDVGRALLAFAIPKGATEFEVLSKILPSEIELSYWQEI